MATIIDGKALAAEMRQLIKQGVDGYKQKYNREIGLAVVMAGDNPASQVYVRNKIKACEEVGIKSFSYTLPKNSSQNDVEELVKALAEDDKINGILVQLPLPAHLDAEKVLKLIPTAKDVDGFSAENIGKLAMNEECLVACTPNGVMKMLEHYNINVSGKRAVVVGRSNIVGKPMAMLLLNADATVTVCHSRTKNLKAECLNADILIAAVGKAKFITADMVKEGAVVIDVGMNRDENGKLCGDVDFESVKEKCSYITPVPGGVGPMTITMLMYNTLQAALFRR
ncbi:MAG: bifunctional methylenetetrahydrofolate dehydrogenase/methenyltetrahydrofolate cyclohydrolase FolD [Clostridia bacterium]|nr:bifunctional methylenetetrahydrofolate dehydrogenase/methenyltetrahydrofolate cyclohydrolase FolD [Clostridia bacterium]